MKQRPKSRKIRKGKAKEGNRLLRHIFPLTVLVTIVAVVLVSYFRDERIGDCGDYSKQGIDVSHHQGVIDWDKVSASGNIRYVYIKASEGATHKDTRYHENTHKARAAGIPVGSYHYFLPHVAVDRQLDNFVSMVDMSSQDLIPVVDIEENGKLRSKKAICDSLSKFVKLITAHCGVEPIIYTGQSYYHNTLRGRIGNHKLWIARYGILKLKLRPQLDNRECNMWQYSNRGRVDGINGDVDLNTLCGDWDVEDIMIKR